jgi:hypothetical protein
MVVTGVTGLGRRGEREDEDMARGRKLIANLLVSKLKTRRNEAVYRKRRLNVDRAAHEQSRRSQ